MWRIRLSYIIYFLFAICFGDFIFIFMWVIVLCCPNRQNQFFFMYFIEWHSWPTEWMIIVLLSILLDAESIPDASKTYSPKSKLDFHSRQPIWPKHGTQIWFKNTLFKAFTLSTQAKISFRMHFFGCFWSLTARWQFNHDADPKIKRLSSFACW